MTGAEYDDAPLIAEARRQAAEARDMAGVWDRAADDLERKGKDMPEVKYSGDGEHDKPAEVKYGDQPVEAIGEGHDPADVEAPESDDDAGSSDAPAAEDDDAGQDADGKA